VIFVVLLLVILILTDKVAVNATFEQVFCFPYSSLLRDINLKK